MICFFIEDLNFLITSIRAMEFIISRNRLYANSNFEGVEERYITHRISSISPQIRIVKRALSNTIFPFKNHKIKKKVEILCFSS